MSKFNNFDLLIPTNSINEVELGYLDEYFNS